MDGGLAKPVAEAEGRSVIFFVILPRLGMIEAGSKVDGRVISYAWNWVLGGQPLNGRNRVLDKGCALSKCKYNITNVQNKCSLKDYSCSYLLLNKNG